MRWIANTEEKKNQIRKNYKNLNDYLSQIRSSQYRQTKWFGRVFSEPICIV